MLTLAKLQVACKKAEVQIEDGNSPYEKRFCLRKDNSENAISLEEGQSQYSCAIEEFGGFDLNKDLGSHWDLLLQYFVQKSKHHYFKCAVPNKKEWEPLIEGLKKVGFEERAKEKSNHGKYTVSVWEYIKK